MKIDFVLHQQIGLQINGKNVNESRESLTLQVHVLFLKSQRANCPLTCGQCNDSPTQSPTVTRYPVLRVVIPLVITVQSETIPDDPDDPDELASLEGAFTTSLQASLPSGSKVVNLKISTSADSRIMHWEKCWCQYFLRCRSRTGT
mmetsp:Transcript_6508/g.7018  ORF Transcript_6508/g.7018 Transcript_6508/m.7018 type:complete len:146 (+) Transcript_6508:748-1185(+)